MSDSYVSFNRGDLVDAYDDNGNLVGRFRISRVAGPKVVKVVNEDGIIKSFPPNRLKLQKRGR